MSDWSLLGKFCGIKKTLFWLRFWIHLKGCGKLSEFWDSLWDFDGYSAEISFYIWIYFIAGKSFFKIKFQLNYSRNNVKISLEWEKLFKPFLQLFCYYCCLQKRESKTASDSMWTLHPSESPPIIKILAKTQSKSKNFSF